MLEGPIWRNGPTNGGISPLTYRFLAICVGRAAQMLRTITLDGDHNMDNTSPSRILRMPDVCDRTGLSRSSIYELSSIGLFPRRVKLATRASGWAEAEVDQWIRDRLDDRTHL